MSDSVNHKKIPSISSIPAFLAAGGETGKIILEHDWSETSLGPIDTWPLSLRTTLGILLNSGFPKFLFWGEDLICFYNDAFRPSLGVKGKHPAIGKTGQEVWPEIWHFIGPLIEQVIATGKPVWFEDQFVPFYRNGKLEDIYWTFSYSAAFGDKGQINGVFVTCTETTQKVLNKRKLEDSKDQLEFAIEATELGTWDLDPVSNKFTGNQRLKEWFGLDPQEEIDLNLATNVIAERDRKRVFEAIELALKYSSGGNYDIEYSIINQKTSRERAVRAKGRAWFNNDKIAYRFNGTLQDITDRKKAEESLKRSNEWYQLVNKATQDAIWDYNLVTNEISWNEIIYSMFNYKPEELKAEASWWEDHIHNEDRERVIQGIRKAIDSGEDHWSDEYRFLKGDSGFRYVYDRGFIIHDDSGKAVRMIGSMQDITARRNAEAEQQKQIAVIENSQDFISISDLDGNVLFLNKAGQKLVGLNALKEVRAIRVIDYFAPEEKDFIQHEVLPKIFNEGSWAGETKFRHFKNGKIIPMTWNAFLMKDLETGKPIGIGCLSQNLTERIKSEQVLKESEERFRTIADASPAFVWTLGPDSSITYLNKAGRSYFGVTLKTLERFNWSIYVHPDEFTKVSKIVSQAINAKEPYEIEQRMKSESGEYRWFLSIGRPALFPSGELYQFVGTSVDITERKLAKENLEIKNAQLTRINNDLDNFIYTASHDLKAPMSNIEGLLQVLRTTLERESDIINDEISMLLQLMEKSIMRFKTTILDLTEITKAQKGQDEDILEISFAQVVEDIKTGIYDKIIESGALIGTNFSEAPTVKFSKKNLNSILYNLLSNAIKYRDKNRAPEIFLKSKKDDGFTIITVQDNGLGIQEKNLEKLFKMFKRFHDHVEGTGIGLYIVKRIIDNSGGKIEVESEPGKGTLFKIFIKDL